MIDYTTSERELIERALKVCESKLNQGKPLTSPSEVRELLALRVSGLEHEVFGVVMVDNRNCYIDSEELFRGTLTQTAVYPREIVKLALQHNAAAVILYHNHPSGSLDPSGADRTLTDALRIALNFVDVKVLDHFIVASGRTYSFAENGIL